ncbi:hypothetical protein A0H81_07592 [Grifola frondosa]|uniref:Aminoglycoside phosphotransferase domain-containing protein n=1 Tax=Grifola frondosa TaxID=5627 RepID=A0A1C7M570_GRIFR|nr:hypothetical protein A0H81_07592 [Grifola frondosa]
MRYVADRTHIPVPQIRAFRLNTSEDRSTTPFVILEKPSGVPLDTVIFSLSPFEQNAIVAQMARWTLEIFKHRFDAIGSLFMDEAGDYRVGPLARRPFYVDGRAKLALDRGPFRTAKAYYTACAQREMDCSRVLFVQDAPPTYQRDLEDTRLTVERIVGLMCDLTDQCQGLDDGDPEVAPFSLDIHDIGLKDIYVSSANRSQITSIIDWQFTCVRPLWCCARLPAWLRPSLSEGNEVTARLSAIFRAEVARIEGAQPIFLRSLDSDDTRSVLDELSDYDAFRDGFLLLPALENILATLPGHEDVAGLTALLDPATLPGRVARISLLTRGSNTMYLAMTPPRSNLDLLVGEDGMEILPPLGNKVTVL